MLTGNTVILQESTPMFTATTLILQESTPMFTTTTMAQEIRLAPLANREEADEALPTEGHREPADPALTEALTAKVALSAT